MNPGLRDTLVAVYHRTTEEETFGTAVTLEHKGDYWASVTFVTKSLVYSGNEKYNKSNWPMPVVRFTFGLDFEFPYKGTEFHLNGEVYELREPGIRPVRTRFPIIVYNCTRQISGEKIKPPLPPL